MARRPVLDEIKKREILAILAVGCSQRTAAHYVGCAPNTIQNTARRDAAFAADLERAQTRWEINYLERIRKAAMKEQYWRAAAWVLERRNPEDYGPRQTEGASLEQVQQMLGDIVDFIIAEIPDPALRRQILDRMQTAGGLAPCENVEQQEALTAEVNCDEES